MVPQTPPWAWLLALALLHFCPSPVLSTQALDLGLEHLVEIRGGHCQDYSFTPDAEDYKLILSVHAKFPLTCDLAHDIRLASSRVSDRCLAAKFYKRSSWLVLVKNASRATTRKAIFEPLRTMKAWTYEFSLYSNCSSDFDAWLRVEKTSPSIEVNASPNADSSVVESATMVRQSNWRSITMVVLAVMGAGCLGYFIFHRTRRFVHTLRSGASTEAPAQVKATADTLAGQAATKASGV